jgi:spore maturation protein A
MLNKIWLGLLCIGILYGFAKAAYQTATSPTPLAVNASETATTSASTGSLVIEFQKAETTVTAMGKALNAATLDAATTSVAICIGLIGIMALWLGLMNVAKDAGLVEAFARLLRPIMRFIFPEIPNGHPAQGAILLNLSANMLGLDNAATPMGLKAMRELQELNPVKDTATNSMAMFLAINTSSITIIPFTIMGYRALSGSRDPAQPVVGTLIATIFSTIVAIIVTRWLSGWPRFRALPEAASAAPSGSPTTIEGETTA